MASGKKKTTANKSTAAAKKSTAKRSSTAAKSGRVSAEKRKETLAREKRKQEIRKDLILLVAMVVTILLFLALYDRVGSVGKGLAAFEYGILGSLAYAFPFFILLSAIYLLILGKEYPAHAWGKALLAFVMLTLAAGAFELAGSKGGLLPNLAAYYRRGRTLQLSGGLFGGFWCRLLVTPLGKLGTWIVLIALFIGGLMLLFGKALLTALGRKGSKVVSSIRDENTRYRSAAEERRLTAQLRLEERERAKAEEKAARLKAEEEERKAIMAKLAAQQEERKKAEAAAAKAQPVKLNEVQRKADTPVSPSLRKEQESWLKQQAEDRARQKSKEEADRKYGTQGSGWQQEKLDEQEGILSSGSPLGGLINEMDESRGVKKDTRTIREIGALDAKAVGSGKRELYSDDIIMAGRDNMQASEYKATGRIAQSYGDRVKEQTAAGSGSAAAEAPAQTQKPAADPKPDLRINQYSTPGGDRAFGETEEFIGQPVAKSAEKAVQTGTGTSARPLRDTVIPSSANAKPIIETGRPDGDEFEDPREVSERLKQAGKDTVATKDDSIWNTDKERSGSGSATFTAPEKPVSAAGKGVAVAGKGVAAAGRTPAQAGSASAAELPKNNVPHKEYKLPPTSLLNRGRNSAGMKESDLRRTAKVLEETLNEFGVAATVTDVSCGPSVTRYELKPEQGVRVNRIASLADDIKLALAVTDVRIEAPIPGKSAVGIEVPNSENQTVFLRNVIESEEFRRMNSKIAFAVGQDIGGQIMVTDMAKMPHLLIAGSTGSGKSVCINSIIMSLLYRAKPDEVQLIMIDPKVVELGVYNGIPHLRIPVVTDPKLAADALSGAVKEMTRRYKLFADLNVRDIKSYNAKLRDNPEEYDSEQYQPLPQIVIIVDEFADLMMVAAADVEQSICRLAQLARAAGMHLVLATQRPSANVITGLIKANVQSRIAFAVSSSLDSRIILDMNGAEKLLGKGDMLFYPTGYPKPVRVQGCFVSDDEIAAVTDFWKKQGGVSQEEMARQSRSWMNDPVEREHPVEDERDELFIKAADYIIDSEKASIGNLQRIFRIGFNRAARLMDQLAEAGIVGKDNGTKSREIMMDAVQLADWKHENGYE